MTKDTNSTEDDLADNLTLVVNPDMIIRAMHRNARDYFDSWAHLLRFNQPFEGHVEGSIHVHQKGNFWPNPESAPLTIAPEEFIEDHPTKGTAHPEQWAVEEAAKEADGVDDIEDVSQETLNDTWGVFLEVWETQVRRHLNDKVELNEFEHGLNVELRVVYVECEDS